MDAIYTWTCEPIAKIGQNDWPWEFDSVHSASMNQPRCVGFPMENFIDDLLIACGMDVSFRFKAIFLSAGGSLLFI